jgi:inner membrane protein
VLGMGQLGYLLHHRGHTHTVVFAVLAGLLLWGAVLALRRAARAPGERGAMLGLAVAGTLSHIVLDWTNSYGVHPFWPVDDRWYYGDAVFIVEPWLWLAGLVPMLLVTTSRVLRVVLGILLVGILAAAWRVDMVGRDVAIALTVAAAAGLLLLRLASPPRRVWLGIAAWLVVEVVFFASTHVARGHLRDAVGPALADAVLTPAPGNPLCVGALVVELDGATYRASSATVAPWPALRDAGRCDAPGGDVGMQPSTRAASAQVRWGAAWSAPAAELRALAAASCEVMAALRFIRVPAWSVAGDVVELADLRYGRRGFAAVTLSARPAACPPHVPPWVPPRADLLAAP